MDLTAFRYGSIGSLFTVCACIFSPASANDVEANPFARFVGIWKLKDDLFQQVWDGETVETLTIPNHRTDCGPINTNGSALCVVDAGDIKGHILWAFDQRTRTFGHLSHFGAARMGQGTGAIGPDDMLRIEIRFSDEPARHYRIYTYEWKSADEYKMISRQYDATDVPTGNWYGGTFVRVKNNESASNQN